MIDLTTVYNPDADPRWVDPEVEAQKEKAAEVAAERRAITDSAAEKVQAQNRKALVASASPALLTNVGLMEDNGSPEVDFGGGQRGRLGDSPALVDMSQPKEESSGLKVPAVPAPASVVPGEKVPAVVSPVATAGIPGSAEYNAYTQRPLVKAPPVVPSSEDPVEVAIAEVRRTEREKWNRRNVA